MPKLSIVVPVYYNEDNLRPLYADLKEKLLDRDNPFEVEIVMVDDGSGDRSYQVMEELKAQDDRIHLYHLSRNFGSDAAWMPSSVAAQYSREPSALNVGLE